MRKGLFTVGFMVLITSIFISKLAVVNEISRERIVQNQQNQKIRSILYACNIFPDDMKETDFSPYSTTSDIPWKEEELLTHMRERSKYIRLPVKQSLKDLLSESYLLLEDSVDIILVLDEAGQIAGHGFLLRGKGLWGTIAAFAVVNADLTRMIGIDFTDQVETPGLGARITESEFKYFFRGLNLEGFFSNMKTPVTMISKKEKSNLEKPSNTIQAITGATQTCNGVLKMVNIDLRFYLTIIRDNQHFIEKLTS